MPVGIKPSQFAESTSFFGASGPEWGTITSARFVASDKEGFNPHAEIVVKDDTGEEHIVGGNFGLAIYTKKNEAGEPTFCIPTDDGNDLVPASGDPNEVIQITPTSPYGKFIGQLVHAGVNENSIPPIGNLSGTRCQFQQFPTGKKYISKKDGKERDELRLLPVGQIEGAAAPAPKAAAAPATKAATATATALDLKEVAVNFINEIATTDAKFAKTAKDATFAISKALIKARATGILSKVEGLAASDRSKVLAYLDQADFGAAVAEAGVVAYDTAKSTFTKLVD